MTNFGRRLAEMLDEQGMTQADLATKIGVTRAAMSRYVSGDREPRYVTLVRIAEELGVGVGDLIPTEVDSVEAVLQFIARVTLTDDQKARLHRAIDGGVGQ